jgi:[ribosomal protein S5]-alanine N-acetyltransferase
MKAPERLETERLILRRPRLEDADAIFTRFAADADVVRYISWPKHETPEATRTFIAFSDAEWARAPAGPYLIEEKKERRLIGGTGLSFETPLRASTGYVLAKDSWALGYAPESVRAIVDVARSVDVVRLYALCHVDHARSARVLEKCGFVREGVLQRYSEFPNLAPGVPTDVACYALILR